MFKVLTRYVVGDLLRVMVLTTIVLVTVIAFGAAIKPLTDESLLGFSQTIRYIALAMVPMLQFALPFAAGFAATLSIHRMTADNEIVAIAASGVSYGRILLPIAGLGVALTISMVLLTQWVIPKFWAMMEQMIATDVTRIFESSISKGRAFELGDIQIYADQLVVETESESTADTRLYLHGVVAAKLGDGGEVETDITASQALVDIYRQQGRTVLNMVLLDTLVYRPDTGELFSTDRLPWEGVPIPRVIEDEPMAMTRAQLLALRGNPDGFSEVAEKRTTLAEVIRDQELWKELDRRCREQGMARLVQAGPEDRVFEVRADRLAGGVFRADGGRLVEARQLRNGQPVFEIRAKTALLERPAGEAFGDLSFDLVFRDCEVTDLASGAVNRREQLPFTGLTPVGTVADDVLEKSSDELLAMAAAISTPTSAVNSAVERLKDRRENLRLDIIGELQHRYALSLTAMLLMLLGATLAMHLRHALPLTIYLLAFAPSVLDLILISGGQQMIRDGQMLGILVLWSGNALMVVLLVLVYRKLARN